MYDRLASRVVELRIESPDPICFFINSPGGDPVVAEMLLRLARAPRQDGKTCMVTTVCVGAAGSAAADMLCAGDYAIAYADTLVHVHGTRTKHNELTVERLREIEASLREENEYFASKLAHRMFRRFATQALLTAAYETTPPKINVNAVNADASEILAAIEENTPAHADFVKEVMERMARVRQVFDYITKMCKERVADGVLLKHIVDFEVKQLVADPNDNDPEYELTPEMLFLIQSDFLNFKDLCSGEYNRQAVELAQEKGAYFLTDEEMKQWLAIKNPDEKQKFLVEAATPRIFPFWYLVVSVCRLLQTGEHGFSADEAWRFGLIDEVTGSPLPSLRKWREYRDNVQAAAKKLPAKASASSSAPAPQPAQ